MPYRQDIYTGPYVKEIIFTHETEHASGLVLPRPVAHLRLVEVAQKAETSSLVVPNALLTAFINEDRPVSMSREIIPELSFEEPELKLFSVRALTSIRRLLENMDFVEAIGVTADTATLEETDEVDDIKRAVAAELSEKDDRPHVGFYL